MSLGENLKILRKNSNLTQEELANKLSVTKQAVYKWETNKCYPDLENLISISKLYNVTIDEMLNNTVDLKLKVNNMEIKEAVSTVNSINSAKNNMKKYLNYFPSIGLVVTISLFILFFLIMGVNKEDYMIASLYCFMPVIVFTLIYLPAKMFVSKSNW